MCRQANITVVFVCLFVCVVSRCFNQASLEEILAALEKENTEWAKEQLQV